MSQSNVVTEPADRMASRRSERSIGALLIDAGRLTPQDAERILRLQREGGMRFGDAAIKLGLVSAVDIDFALARQFDYPYLRSGESKVSEKLRAAFNQLSPEVESLRALRTQLMLRWFDNDASRKALAVVSAGRNEGRSFIAANLAVVFSQIGEHTLLIDADMRNPSQHALFGLDNRVGLSAVLSDRGGPEVVQRIPGLAHLSVLTAGILPPNPLELLARPLFPKLLEELGEKFDVILLDSPAAAEHPDAQTLVVSAGAALIVARKNVAPMWRVRGVSDSVAPTSAVIVGTVLNDF